MGQEKEPVLNNGAHGAAPPEERSFAFLQFTNILIRNRYLVVALPLLLGTFAVVTTMRQPRAYQARASFIPNAGSEQSGAQFNAVAAQLGINFNTSQPGASPAFYGQLLTTRGILRDAVQSTYEIQVDGERRRGNLVQFYGLDTPEAVAAAGEPPGEAAMGQLEGSLETEVDIETGIVRVTVGAPHPALAEAIAARMIDLTQDFDLNKRRTQASARRQFAQERLRESQQALRVAEGALGGFVASNRLFQHSPTLLLRHAKLSQEVELRQQVYVALAQSYEQARMDEIRNTPVITVLETPAGTAEPQARGTIAQGMFGAFVGLILAVVFSLIREQLRTARASGDEEFEEFTSLRRAAWGDLRRMVPGLRGRARSPTA